MKKIILLTVLSFCILTAANAQLRFGAKTGINIAGEKYSNTAVYSTSNHVFFTGGLMVRYQLKNKAGLESGLYFSPEGTEESYESGSSTVTGVVKITRINLPVLFQYKLSKEVYAETGPQIGFVASAKGKYTSGTYDFKEATKPSLMSWIIGAGFEPGQLKGLGINLSYAPGLQPINSKSVNGGKITSSVISLRLFYLLEGKMKKG